MPLIIVAGIDHLGELTILFTKDMIVPYDLTEIDEEVLEIKIYSVDVENTFKRQFEWHVSNYNSTNCTIQIVWDSPPWISSTQVRDKLTFRVLERDKFITPKRLLEEIDIEAIYLESGEWEMEIPPQAYQNGATEDLAEVVGVAGSAVKMYMVAQMIVQPLLLASLSMLWGLINGL